MTSTPATGTAPFRGEVDVAVKRAVAEQLSRLLPQAAARAAWGL